MLKLAFQSTTLVFMCVRVYRTKTNLQIQILLNIKEKVIRYIAIDLICFGGFVVHRLNQ